MKLRKWVVVVVFFALTTPGYAYDQRADGDAYDVMIDMVLRPVSLVATIIGAGVFVGVSPLTALATVPPPHDAFKKLADTIVCKPWKFTFNRRVGDYRYDKGCNWATEQPVQPVIQREPPKPVVMEPEYKVPDDTNQKIDAIFKKQMMK